MTPHELLTLLHTAEKLKDTTRHCDTSGGRRESVAEHSWRLKKCRMHICTRGIFQRGWSSRCETGAMIISWQHTLCIT